MLYLDESYNEEHRYDEKLPDFTIFYVNYGLAILASTKNKINAKKVTLEKVVEALQIEQENGNENARLLLIELYSSGLLNKH